jgi:hypothetical protein
VNSPGGSAFSGNVGIVARHPSYGCSNPTLTVVAMALRLADHLRKQLAATVP